MYLGPEIIVIYFSQCVTSGLLLFKRKIILGMSNYPYAVRPRKKNPKGLMMLIACTQPSPKYSVYHRIGNLRRNQGAVL